MNKIWMLTMIIWMGLYSCSNNGEQGDTAKDGTSVDLGSGPDVELTVLTFDADSRKTEVEIVNRMDEAIKNISGRLVFNNEDGSPLTRANGDAITSPFQSMSNPYVVDAKSKKTIVFGNSIQAGTANIGIIELKVTTTSGKEMIIE